MDKTFSSLKDFETVRTYSFYLGLILGSFFIVVAGFIVASVYRKRRFGGWKSRRASRSFTRSMSSAMSMAEYRNILNSE